MILALSSKKYLYNIDMSCPAGQFYSEAAKRCLRLNVRPGSKGKSQLPCPENQVWNPNPDARRCILKTLYKKIYGDGKAQVASLEQKRLRALTKKVKTPLRNITVKNPSPKAITPALKQSLAIQSAKPRANSVMPPGLLREPMKQWIVTNCRNQEDPIMMDPYEDGTIEEMRSLIKLGSGFCYTAETLDHHVKSSIERGVPIKDMLNPAYRLDAADFGALEEAAKRSKKAYRLPIEPSIKPAAHYKLFIGVANEPDYKLVFMFDERKVKKSASGGLDYSAAIPEGGWIGYLPGTGSAELERLIREAFARGRLFTQAMRPFKCCRFHLKKTKDYWAQGTLEKIKALEEEIRDIM